MTGDIIVENRGWKTAPSTALGRALIIAGLALSQWNHVPGAPGKTLLLLALGAVEVFLIRRTMQEFPMRVVYSAKGLRIHYSEESAAQCADDVLYAGACPPVFLERDGKIIVVYSQGSRLKHVFLRGDSPNVHNLLFHLRESLLRDGLASEVKCRLRFASIVGFLLPPVVASCALGGVIWLCALLVQQGVRMPAGAGLLMALTLLVAYGIMAGYQMASPVAVVAGADGLRVRLLGRRWRTLPWPSISAIEPRVSSGWLELVPPAVRISLALADGHRLRLPSTLTNLPGLLRSVRGHIGSHVALQVAEHL